MTLSEEQLDNVEFFGGLFFPVSEIAIMIDADAEALHEEYANPKSEFFRRYHKGFLTKESKVRQAVIDLALRNSSPAQDVAIEFAKRARIKNSNNG
jgi:hypothetical protein